MAAVAKNQLLFDEVISV